MRNTTDRMPGHGVQSSTLAVALPSQRRAILAGAAMMFLTTVHHVYGAIVYETPERYHAVFIGAAALAIILGAQVLSRKNPTSFIGRAGWWIAWSVNAVVAVLLLGLIEGFYNHAVKVALYVGGLPEEQLRTLFPAPTYELPNDMFFELTGVLQVLPAAFAAYYLARLVVAWRSKRRAPPTGIA